MAYLPKPFQIIEIKTINKEVKLFKIKSNLNPKPGQFLEVSLPGIGECPLASCLFNNQEINLLIKKAGNLTSALFRLKPKDLLYIRGPYGKGFPIKKLENKNLILIAGGTGIAPITSLISYIEQNKEKFKQIIIYFGFRNKNYILLKEKIKQWQKKFNVTITLDKKEKSGSYKQGFVHETINKFPPKKENRIAVMCGPEIMMKSVTQVLNKLGLDNNQIYWSLERRMECGLGICNRCLIQDVYVCKDGPVFRYDVIKPKIENEEFSNKINSN